MTFSWNGSLVTKLIQHCHYAWFKWCNAAVILKTGYCYILSALKCAGHTGWYCIARTEAGHVFVHFWPLWDFSLWHSVIAYLTAYKSDKTYRCIYSHNDNKVQSTLHFTHFSTSLTFASQKAPRYLALTSTPLLKYAGSSACRKQVGFMALQSN